MAMEDTLTPYFLISHREIANCRTCRQRSGSVTNETYW